ncbi:PIN domain-containing protein [Thermococcus sp.]
MKALLDTNILYNYFFETSLTKQAKDLLIRIREPYISTTILNELYYSVMRRKAERTFGIKSYRKLKEFLSQNGYEPFLQDFDTIGGILELLGVKKIADSQNWELIQSLMFKYNLLPNDATILATCIENDLSLATFDRDYQKVKDVKVLP